MRRVWRLGQTQAVKVVYAVYQETLEEAALALMGEKLKAALLLYGDNAASAITEDAGDGDFLAELAQRVLAGERLAATGLAGLLKPDTRATTRTWGSPTQESVRLEPLPQKLRCVQLALLCCPKSNALTARSGRFYNIGCCGFAIVNGYEKLTWRKRC